MRIVLPDFKEKKALFDYLAEHKSALIAQKRSLPINSEVLTAKVRQVKEADLKNNESLKEGELIVEVIANLANWYDSHKDVMLPDNWNKSIQEKGTLIPHLVDHDHSMRAKVGRTLGVFTREINLDEIGIESDVKTAQALIMRSKVLKDYDEKVYKLYRDGEVNQHSIGLQYVKIDLAINDADYKDEFAMYEKYYPQIVNKWDVDKRGFFWAVRESKIFENSAVLFGSNQATPTISIELPGAGKSHSQNEPEKSTQKLKSIFTIN